MHAHNAAKQAATRVHCSRREGHAPTLSRLISLAEDGRGMARRTFALSPRATQGLGPSSRPLRALRGSHGDPGAVVYERQPIKNSPSELSSPSEGWVVHGREGEEGQRGSRERTHVSNSARVYYLSEQWGTHGAQRRPCSFSAALRVLPPGVGIHSWLAIIF